MTDLTDAIGNRADATGFSGIVSIRQPGEPDFVRVWGLADRRHGQANEATTRFGTASATKGFTALTIMSLVDDRAMALDTTARSVLGSTLPLIDDGVTVEHLLAHRSGIGDYIDEEVLTDNNDYIMPVPLHRLDRPEAYVEVLDGYEQVFTPGSRFAYNNSGYAILAIVAERVSGIPFAQLVDERVVQPAGLTDTGFVRADELPPNAAIGYLGNDSDRTNALHLPLLGTGDGGIYTTAADITQLWKELFADQIVSPQSRELMIHDHSHQANGERFYGLGLILHGPGSAVSLEGADAGVSFKSIYDPDTGAEFTVIGNTTEGAWPLVREFKTADRLTPEGQSDTSTKAPLQIVSILIAGPVEPKTVLSNDHVGRSTFDLRRLQSRSSLSNGHGPNGWRSACTDHARRLRLSDRFGPWPKG